MLNTHASPLKKKILQHNNVPILRPKNFERKEIMKRSKLKYSKKRNYENWSLYKKQRYYSLSKNLTSKNWTLKKLVKIKHFRKLSSNISVIKTINVQKLPLLKTILL